MGTLPNSAAAFLNLSSRPRLPPVGGGGGFLDGRSLVTVRGKSRHGCCFALRGRQEVPDGKATIRTLVFKTRKELFASLSSNDQVENNTNLLLHLCALSCGATSWLSFVEAARSSEGTKPDMVYEIGEPFELGIHLSYLLVLRSGWSWDLLCHSSGSCPSRA